MAAAITAPVKQSKTEIRQWDFDFTNDLLGGVSVSSATATHSPPSGSASTPTVGTIANNTVPVTLGPLTVTGRHLLTVTATLSNGEKSQIQLAIDVIF